MKIDILNGGYVRLVNVMGSDQTVADAARVSFDKRSVLNEDGTLADRDAKLIDFLWRNDHTAPFRHAALTFEVKVPMMVKNQHWKHVIASTQIDDQNGWNEMSKRYVTDTPEFNIPRSDEWRSAPSNKKQGSGEPVSETLGNYLSDTLLKYIEDGVEFYEAAMEAGVCAEQARLFLPAYGLFIRYFWTTSLHALMHFLQLREAHDAQGEIRDLANAVRELATPHFPVSLSKVTKPE